MTFKSITVKFIILEIALAGMVQICCSENCTKVYFSVDEMNTPCVGNQSSEVIRQYFKHPEAYAICCLPNTEAEKEFVKETLSCEILPCLPLNIPNHCSLLYKRQLYGRQLFYENVAHESCSIFTWWWPFSSEESLITLCCPTISAESWLKSMTRAEDHEFPHQAQLTLIHDNQIARCGATIYNRRFLITAAHCVLVTLANWKLANPSDISVVLGSNIRDVRDSKYNYKVKHVHPYPHYGQYVVNGIWRYWNPDSAVNVNDIALLELDHDIEFGEHVRALEIAPFGFNPSCFADKVVLLGWGNGGGHVSAAYLRKHTAVLRTEEQCLQQIGVLYQLAQWQFFCVSGMMEGVLEITTSAGDSCGAAICRGIDGHPVLCGVISFGPNVQDSQKHWDEAHCKPCGMTEVAYFRDWIEEIAGPQDQHSLHKPHLFGKVLTDDIYLHQVSIITQNKNNFCGGTLIEDDVLITAAHCVIDPCTGDILSNFIITSRTKEIAGIKAAKALPNFNVRVATKQDPDFQRVLKENIYDNDMAVVLLDKRFNISANKLARLPNSRENFSTGKEISVSKDGVLMSREFSLLSTQKCQERVRGARVNLYGKVDNNIICGVEKYSGGSTCDRDLGGGLICQDIDGLDVLCGIQHLRLCISSLPSGFVNVSEYVFWILDTIKQLQFTTRSPQGFLDSYYRKVFNPFL